MCFFLAPASYSSKEEPSIKEYYLLCKKQKEKVMISGILIVLFVMRWQRFPGETIYVCVLPAVPVLQGVRLLK